MSPLPLQGAGENGLSALERLPSTVRDLLQRGNLNGHVLAPAEREQIAVMLLETGIKGAGNLTWMAKLIRHRLGVSSEYPVAPGSLIAQGYAHDLALERAEQIASTVLDGREAAA